MKYDPNDKPQGGTGARTRVPAGRYVVHVTRALYGVDKWTADKPPEEQARCLDLEVTVSEGPHAGRKVWMQYYQDGAVSPGRIRYGKMMVRKLSAALDLGPWEADPHTGECHALVGAGHVACMVGANDHNPDKDEVREWLGSAHPTTRATPAPRPTAPAYDDTQRRNGQLAAVANRPLPAADFDDNVPF